MNGLLVVGGSYAGLGIAAEARARGFDGPIRIVTEDRWAPYQRPPLSKGYLLGKVPGSELPLRGEAFYADQRIDLVLGTRVTAVELPGVVRTDTGVLRFDALAIATGMRARTLPVPGAGLRGVLSLRTRDDADAIRAILPDIASVVVIGGGYIGLEVTSGLVALGKQVTVLEGTGRLLSRVTFPLLSAFIESEHLHHGVRIVCGARVVAIEGEGRVRAVRTADGLAYPADLVLVAVGAVPNLAWLAGTGLDAAEGVPVDALGRTALPGVYAAGDCARHDNPFGGGMIRLESVQNATEQARAAGAALAGVAKPYAGVPWFWSDQYGLKLQMAGLSTGATAEIIRGSVEEKRFSIFYLRQGRLVGIDSVNAPGDHMLGRRILARRPEVSADQLSDPDFDLRALAA